MKKIVIAILVILGIFSTFATANADEVSKPRVGLITRYYISGDQHDWLRQLLATDRPDVVVDSLAVSDLVATGKVDYVDLDMRQITWSEQDMPVWRMDSSTMPATGKSWGLQYILVIDLTGFTVSTFGTVGGSGEIIGGFQTISTKLSGTVRLVEVETTRVVWSSQVSGSGSGTYVVVGYNGIGATWGDTPAGKAIKSFSQDLTNKFINGFVVGYQPPVVVPPTPPASLSELQQRAMDLPQGIGASTITFDWNDVKAIGPKPGDLIIILNTNNKPVAMVQLSSNSKILPEGIWYSVVVLRGVVPNGIIYVKKF